MSRLDQFLDTQGTVDSGGQFTLDRESALRKLAQFGLPFEGAWVLKVVQAIVASGSKAEISVKTSRYQVAVHFGLACAWTPDAVERAFFEPERVVSKDLAHLRAALWSLAFSEKLEFRLRLEEGGQQLVCRAGQLHMVGREKSTAGACLEVYHTGAKVNATVGNVLTEFAYPCPLPLTLDARRLDGIQFSPTHGFTSRSQTFVFGWAKGEVPNLPIPEGTKDLLLGEETSAKPPEFQAVAMSALRQLSRAQEGIGMAYLVALHRSLKFRQDPGQRGRNERCLCHWVADGVVAQIEPFEVPAKRVSLACYVEASDLATDLTTMAPRDSQEKRHRQRWVVEALGQELSLLPENVGSGLSSNSMSVPTDIKMAIGATGLFIAKVVAVVPVVVVLGLAGHYSRARSRFSEDAKKGLSDLKGSWAKTYPASSKRAGPRE